MAATDARPVPRKNAAFRFYFAIRKNDGTLITTWAGQDSEVSLDGAAFSDCTNEATEIGTSGCGYIDLTSSEMNADSVVLKITVTNTDALPLVFTLFPEESGDYRSDIVMISGDSTAADNLEAILDGTGGVTLVASAITLTTPITANVTQFGSSAGTFSGGRPEVNTTHAAGTAWGSGAITAGSIASNAITSAKIAAGAITATGIATGAIDADAIAADAVTEIQAGLALAADLATVDTVVDAIKAKTDNLPTDPADQSLVEAAITAAVVSAATIADAVWDEALSGHSTAGTAGLALSTASSGGVDPSVLADAIWDEALSGHATSGTAGAVLSAVNTKTTNLPSDPADQSAVEAAITSATSGLSTLTAAEVNAQVLDVLNVDTFAELSSVPSATATLRQMMQFVFMWFRNKSTQTSSQRRLFADDGSTAVATETVSDDGTTYTKGEAS